MPGEVLLGVTGNLAHEAAADVAGHPAAGGEELEAVLP